MAKIIDPVKVDEEVNASVSEEPEVQEEVAEVPEQYRDKSPAELIKMHQELETKLGNQGNELGELRGAKQEVTELRKVVDDFILNQSSNDKAGTCPKVDFLQTLIMLKTRLLITPHKEHSKLLFRYSRTGEASL